MLGLPANSTMFVVAMILAMCAYLVLIALGIGIKTHAPSLSHVVGDAWVALWPFWVFSFLSPTKRRALSPFLRSVAVVAMTTLGLSVAMMLFIVFRFAASGGSL